MRAGSDPANLALRFLLELVALFALGWWGWSLTDSWLRFVLVVVFVLAAATIWGTFAVPDDPSRSGEAPVVVRGWVRLGLEAVTFGAAVIGLASVGRGSFAIGFLVVVVVHYVLSIDRISWLLQR
jgi:hypothetical protein